MSSQSNHSILIVDDEEDLLEIFSHYFEENNYKVDTANSVVNAQKKLNAAARNGELPDVILSDVRMPRQNGLDLAKWVKSESMGVPIIFITGFSDVSSSEATEADIVAVLKKPIEGIQLVTEVNSILSSIDRKVS